MHTSSPSRQSRQCHCQCQCQCLCIDWTHGFVWHCRKSAVNVAALQLLCVYIYLHIHPYTSDRVLITATHKAHALLSLGASEAFNSNCRYLTLSNSDCFSRLGFLESRSRSRFTPNPRSRTLFCSEAAGPTIICRCTAVASCLPSAWSAFQISMVLK